MKHNPIQPRQRKSQAIRNLLATVALSAAIWSMAGSPLPSLLGFRALERRALIPPTEIFMDVYEKKGYGHGYIGFGEDVIVLAFPRSGRLGVFHRHSHSRVFVFEGYFPALEPEPIFGTAHLIPDPPAEAVSAQLTLQYEEKTTVATALKRDSVFLFVISDNIWDAPWEDFYEVAFFDSAGNLIETFGNMN